MPVHVSVTESIYDIPLKSLPLHGGVQASSTQEGYWFLNEMATNKSAYNLSVVLRGDGQLQPAILEESLRDLVLKHEILRSFFSWEGDALIQKTNSKSMVSIELKESAKNNFREVIDEPFDLTTGPLYRFCGYQSDNNSFALLIVMHHIIIDFHAINILLRDLEMFYNAASSKQPITLERRAVDYSGYAAWQKRWLNSENFEKKLLYWKSHLAEPRDALPLPMDKPHCFSSKSRCSRCIVFLDGVALKKIKEFCQRNGVTLFSGMFTAYVLLLYQYSQQEDITVGTPVANRNRGITKEIIGCMANLVALRVKFSKNQTVSELLATIWQAVKSSFINAEVPYNEILKILVNNRNGRNADLFNTMFNMLGRMPQLNFSGQQVDVSPGENPSCEFDLVIEISEINAMMNIAFVYDHDLFKSETISDMAHHYLDMIQIMVEEQDKPISKLKDYSLKYESLKNHEKPQISSLVESVPHSPPITAMESMLVKIWASVLSVSKVGRSDDFFKLGGHSLLMMQCAINIRNQLNIDVPIRAIFDRPVLHDFAKYLESLVGQEQLVFHAIKPRPLQYAGEAPLSLNQEAFLWLSKKMKLKENVFNIPLILKINGNLHIDQLELACREIIMRHETFRTTFSAGKDGSIRQIVSPHHNFNLSVINDYKNLAKISQAKAIQGAIDHRIGISCDIETGPLLNFTLFVLDENRFLLLMVFHNVIFDGWTFDRFLEELGAILSSHQNNELMNLPEVAVQYADYAWWQRNCLDAGFKEDQKVFWIDYLKDAPHDLALPFDYLRQEHHDYQGACFNLNISSELVSKLRAYTEPNRFTVFAVLFGVFASLLYCYTEQFDIIVGTSVANRQVQGLEKLMGLVMSNIAVRFKFNQSTSFESVVKDIITFTSTNQKYQSIPLEQIMNELSVPIVSNKHPLFQVMFSYQAMHPTDATMTFPADLKTQGITAGYHIARWDLRLRAYEKPNGMTLSFEYAKKLFKTSTIEILAAKYKSLLESCLVQPKCALTKHWVKIE